MSAKKKFETNYTLTFHVEAENSKEAGKISQEVLLDYLKSIRNESGGGSNLRILHGFTEEIIEL